MPKEEPLKQDVSQEEIIEEEEEEEVAEDDKKGANQPNMSERGIYQEENSSTYKLGSLSAYNESLKDSTAIGNDNGGGYSYGIFQIETNHGTMSDYIDYLKRNEDYQGFADKLLKAGGTQGALHKSSEFERAWTKLAQDSKFKQAQYNFVFDKKFKPLIDKVSKNNGLDLEKRHPVVKDVLFSMAVQRSGAAKIINSALIELKKKYNNLQNVDDSVLIKELYKQRSIYVKKLPESQYRGDHRITAREKENILNNRYPEEMKEALEYLK